MKAAVGGSVPDIPSHPGDRASGSGADPNYPRQLERDVVSDAGTHYHLRPIRPDDAPGLITFHRHLAARSIYLRFFSLHPELSAKEVEHFTCVDHINRLALVAELNGRLIAVGRFESGPGDTEAEVAFVVSDEFQHHGIGSVLLDELAKAARERGIVAFRAETLAENRAMLDVFHHAGFPVSSSFDYGTVTIRFPIEPTDAYRAALARREATHAGRLEQHPAPASRLAGTGT
jgi:GNAT superfamily N-acetyltransferase